jgi:hypothetical protein
VNRAPSTWSTVGKLLLSIRSRARRRSAARETVSGAAFKVGSYAGE